MTSRRTRLLVRFRIGVVLIGAIPLAACAWFSPDSGMSTVAGITNKTLRKDVIAIRSEEDAAFARSRVEQLLRRPLTVETTVQVSLLSNSGLQAAYNELSLAEADMVESSLPPSPTFAVSRIVGSNAFEYETQVIADILALATLPARSEIAATRFHQAQLRAVQETLRLAAEVRRAYYDALAWRELTDLLAEWKTTADAAAQVAVKLGETGSMNKLDQARELGFYSETTVDLATVRQEASTARERLAGLLGLWGRDLDFKLPNRLPPLPVRPQTLPGIEMEAVARRVDLQIGRVELDWLAKSYGLTRATRFINMFEAAGITKKAKEPEGMPFRINGGAVQFQIPIFDFGEVRVQRAEQTYMQAVNRLAEKAVSARAQGRSAYRVYRSTYDIAGYYQREVLPIRKIITEETQLRFSAMQIDVFALLIEARQRLAVLRAAIEAKRAFWQAKADLQATIIGGGVVNKGSGGSGLPAGERATTAD
jgi:outer membrane protein TolC